MTPLTFQKPSSLNRTMVLSIKQCPDTCTLHSNLMHRQTDRCTSMLLCILVAPDTLFHSTKFQSCIPFQFKVILTHVNSTGPPSWPKIYPKNLLHCLPQIHSPSYIPVKHCLKYWILIKNRVLNIYLYRLSWYWPSHCPLCTCRQCSLTVNGHNLDK